MEAETKLNESVKPVNELKTNNLKNENKCVECKRVFKNYSVLRRHVKRFHSEKVNELSPLKRSLKTYKFNCHCGKNFTHRFNYVRHLRTHLDDEEHAEDHRRLSKIERKIKNHKKCPLCGHVGVFKTEMYTHYRNEHNLIITIQTLQFSDLDNFQIWLKSIEEKSKSRFVKERGVTCNKSNVILTYICHRSGFYTSESKGMRTLKTQGSNKINGFCPAGVKVTIKDGVCYARYVQEHVGHDMNPIRLPLRAIDKQELASKLAAKVPFSEILDEIKDKISGDSRLHLLTKKDLYNIQAAYSLQPCASKPEEDVTVGAWVHEILQSQDSCIKFYKPQNTTLVNYPELCEEDYILCILNNSQLETLKQFGNDFVCFDTVKGKFNSFELHTLTTIDKTKHAFPCCFIITNRTDKLVLEICLKALREQIKNGIRTKFFMGDVEDMFYEAWVEVMGATEHRSYSNWLVDYHWRNHLNLIKSKHKQAEIYNTLCTFLQEKNHQTFTEMLQNFILKLENDQQTKNFALYFNKYFTQTTNLWANCFKPNNSNKHLERMHMTIKYLYLGGKNTKRLDRAITCLMKFVKHKSYEQNLEKKKRDSKLSDIKTRHENSLDLNIESVTENDDQWTVVSNKTSHIIFKNEIICDCLLRCSICDCCIHQYSCSCMDSAIKWNMCQHIHLLCRYLKLKSCDNYKINSDEDGDAIVYFDMPTSNSQIVYKILSVEPVNEPIEVDIVGHEEVVIEERENIRQYLNQVLDSIQTKEEFDTFKQLIAPIESAFPLTILEETTNPNNIDFI